MTVSTLNPRLFFNRELSWIRFNERVLEEALDPTNPLLERLKFLSIFSSNLDEFFMIRVAGLKEQLHANILETAADGISPKETLIKISESLHPLVAKQSEILMNDLIPTLRRKGLRLRSINTLNANQSAQLKKYFREKIFPILTPLAVDSAHPFPKLRNLALHLLVELKVPFKKGDNKIALVPVPTNIPRFISIPSRKDFDFVTREQVICEFIDELFPNMKILRISEFRITRNADLDISEAEADDLLKLIERELRKRRLGTVNRLEVTGKINPEIRSYLMESFGLSETDVYDIDSFLDIGSFINLLDTDLPLLKDNPFNPALNEQIVRSSNIFEAISKGDILLHHPYDSFQQVVELVQEASLDPDVLAIKITLYRTSGKSPIVQALKEANAKGKQVTALIELKARFDEETNIVWAKELESVGVHVVYGLMGLKTHCKICLIIRQEQGKLAQYCHISTGNYNIRTSRIYTDISYFTCNEEIGKDLTELFNFLTGFSRQEKWRKLLVAPISLRERLVNEIQECIRRHTIENPSEIRMVMNSLVDTEMIQMLYKASKKGVKISLIVRGICCLVPGLKDISENIEVHSIVGRFLEHARIYTFSAAGESRIFIGSADLMQRNLNRRIEVLLPIEQEEGKKQIFEILRIMFSDNVKARVLNSDGSYVKSVRKPGEQSVNAQMLFLNDSIQRQKYIDTIL
jgi:polyphosphate kinase